MALKINMATVEKDTILGVGILVIILSGVVHYMTNVLPGGWIDLFQALVGAGSFILVALGAPVPVLTRAPKTVDADGDGEPAVVAGDDEASPAAGGQGGAAENPDGQQQDHQGREQQTGDDHHGRHER